MMKRRFFNSSLYSFLYDRKKQEYLLCYNIDEHNKRIIKRFSMIDMHKFKIEALMKYIK